MMFVASFVRAVFCCIPDNPALLFQGYRYQNLTLMGAPHGFD